MTVRNAILNGLMCLVTLALPLQCVIDPSAVNVGCACIALFSAFSVIAYIKWGGAVNDQPLSTIAIFGFSVTTQMAALLAQTVFWTPLRNSLYDPLGTFGTLAFYQMVAIGVHMVYRYFSVPNPSRVGVFRTLFNWGGIYRTPQSQVLWAMGFLGIASFAAGRSEGVAGRIGAAFNFFAWAPFLLPLFIREFGPTYCNVRRTQIFLVLYTGMVVMIGIAVNVRIIMFIGVATVALLYLLIAMRSRAPVTKKAMVRLGIMAVILAVLAVPISDLATSMAIARGVRGKISPVEMIKKTMSVMGRPALIAEYRRAGAGAARFMAYDENYITNPLLARFSETKYHDNAFHFAGLINSEKAKEQLQKVTVDATWAALPTPFLRVFHIQVNKDDLNFSMADYMAYLSRGVPLAGRKTGSMFAQGQAIMGPLFPILYVAMCCFAYALMDLLTLRNADGSGALSPLAMMSTWVFFYRGITSDAISNTFVFIVRDYAQTVLLYMVIFAMARYVLGGRDSRRKSMIAAGWPQAT